MKEAAELEDCLQGKVVRIYGIYSAAFEGSVLGNLKEGPDAWMSGEQFYSVAERCSSPAALREWKNPKGGTFGVVALGILRGRDGFLGFGHMNAFDYEFQVLCLDEMKRFSDSTVIFESQTADVQKAMTSWYNKHH